MDPLKLRLLNDAEKDESTEHAVLVTALPRVPRSGREEVRLGETHCRASAPCVAMERFSAGGMAGASWVALRLPCTATVEFCANGRLCVRCGTQDIGTGTYTMFAQVLHEKTGIPLDRIDVILGDSALPRWADVRRFHGHGIGAQCDRRRASDGAVEKDAEAGCGHERFTVPEREGENVSFTKGRLQGRTRTPVTV